MDVSKLREKQDNRLVNEYSETNCPYCNKIICYHINNVLSRNLFKENIDRINCSFCKERIKIKIKYEFSIEAIK
jgi:hypothetical protein